MNLRFKDNFSKEIINKKRKETSVDINYEDVFTEEEIDDIYQDFINVKDISKIEKTKKENKEEEKVLDTNMLEKKDLEDIKQMIIKVKSNQNAILEILEYLPIPTMDKVQMELIEEDEVKLLNYNLQIFNRKLIIFSTSSKHKQIKELLELLNQISAYILSNSFYIFTINKSPVKRALNIITQLGLNSRINDSILETEKLLNQIDYIASTDIFKQTYNYSTFLLEKGLLLQSIILLNEAISIYIVESAKGFSKPIEKYIFLIGEKNKYKLYSQAKTFFISLFSNNDEEKIIPFFPNHQFVKDIDGEIVNKFKNVNKTWINKGGKNFFKQYSYIIEKVREIRNNLAHGNMDIDFYNLKKDIFELIKDFKYLSIEKNIFKLKS
jgi:hypothetical protein